MNSSGGVKFLSRFVEWLLSFYQDAVDGLIDMLTGGQTDGALMWLMKSWKSLFLLLLIGGIVLNVIIYFVRWKPHWWWFAKKRLVVNDELLDRRSAAAKPRRKPSTIVPRKDAAESLKLSTIAPSPAGKPLKSESPTLFTDDTDDLFDDPSGELMELHTKKRK